MKQFNYDAAITASSLFLAIITISGELFPPLKTVLASITGHHWSAKAILGTAIFIIIGLLYKKESFLGQSFERIAWYSVLFALMSISVFFYFHG